MPEIVGRLRTPRLPSAPSSPVVGEMYYDTTLNQLLYWNGTAWTSSAGSGGADLVYNGQFPTGGPNYTDGDIVIGSDGIAYLCVQPTSAAPVPWTGVAGPVGPPGPQGAQGPAGVAGAAGAGIPAVQNGKWLRGSGGAAVWSVITPADITGLVTPDAAWITMTPLTDTWIHYSNGASIFGYAQYRKLASGLVVCRGLLARPTAPASNSSIFTFPVGCRPINQLLFTVQVNVGTARVDIEGATGRLYYNNPNTPSVAGDAATFLCLDTIRFYPDS